MRTLNTRVLRGLAAASLVVGIALPVGARPAEAAWDPVAAANTIKTMYGHWQNYRAGGPLEATIEGIADAIQQGERGLIDPLDRIAYAEARACTQSALINFGHIELFTPRLQQVYAQDLSACVVVVASVLHSTADQAAVDNLGFALNTVGPLALAANALAGFSTHTLTTVLVNGNETLVARLAPGYPSRELALAVIPLLTG